MISKNFEGRNCITNVVGTTIETIFETSIEAKPPNS